MKALLVITFLLIGVAARSQAFHFVDTSTTLIKDTDQSPAHWYLEVYNDVGVDTTLRWKASFSNIPAQWTINFDDQDNFYATANDGDSADFTLFGGLAFPQKLIIGAAFNGVPGTGSIFFDIYDPENPAYVVTIEYRYIVSAASLEENNFDELITRKGSTLIFDDSMLGGTIQLIGVDGSIVAENQIEKQLTFNELNETGVLIIRAYTSTKSCSQKTLTVNN